MLSALKRTTVLLVPFISNHLFAAPPDNDNCSTSSPFKTMCLPSRTSIITNLFIFLVSFFSLFLPKQSFSQTNDYNDSNPVSLNSSTSCTIPANGNPAYSLNGSTENAAVPAGCSIGIHYDVWFSFVAASTSETVTIGNFGDKVTNPEVQIFSGTAYANFVSKACGSTSATASSLTAGTTYYVRVSNVGSNPSGNGQSSKFDICLTHPTPPAPPPANDDCSGATTLTSATSCSNISGTIVSATASTGLPVGCEAVGTHYDVWYKFVAASNTHTVDVSGQGTSFTNPEIQLYSGTCGSLTSLTCGATSLTSSLLTIGNTYYVRVSNIASSITSNGGFNICVTHPAPPAPPVVVAAGRMNEVYKQTILSGSGILQYPWEITYGPDDKLWITESRGYKVYRMDPSTGSKTTVLDVSQGSTWLPSPSDSLNVQFSSGQNPWPQGGLAGLAIHPQFLDGTGLHDYVYISYVHRYLYTAASSAGIFFRNKIVRFTYNSGTGRLGMPAVVCDTIPGGQDHNSQRMIIAPVTPGGTNYLFYAAGDMGSGQFANRLRPQNAQNPDSYEGKILRFNLEQVAGSWIPTDNPYSSTSAVYSIGIRNNQGFAYDSTTNTLYGSSHGPYSDDEINIIESHRNYGHPLIEGFVDGNYDGNSVQGTNTSVSAGADYTSSGGISTCPPIGSEATNKATIDAAGNGLYKDPLFSAYAASKATVTNIWQTNPGNALPAPGWPTEAWSGLDVYTNTLIPGWKNSLVAASLKWGRLLRIRLNSAGNATAPTNTVSDTVSYFGSRNRFRDLAFSPDGKDIFVIMDNNSTTSGPGSANPVVPTCAGCVQKYTFLGYADAGGKSSIPAAIDVTPGVLDNCTTGTPVTIDNTNNNLWVPITGPDGNIMAEIKANSNNLGAVTSSFYTKSGTLRQRSGKRYLHRNITITPATQPSSAVDIRLYISKVEFDALDADPSSGVTSITDLKILKNNDACGSEIASNTQLINPVYAEAHGTNGYVLQGNINSFSSFYFGSDGITLPLELLTFKGSLQNNSTFLQWETINENNSSHFVVERSVDGRNFESIGTVAAGGNTSSASQYFHTDNEVINLSSAIVYYRLKMVDADNKFNYSAIVTIYLADITNRIVISPNPATDETKVMITSTLSGKANWKLMDNSGRVVMQNTIHIKKGSNNLTINIGSLSSGLYYLNISGAGIDQNMKLQKL